MNSGVARKPWYPAALCATGWADTGGTGEGAGVGGARMSGISATTDAMTRLANERIPRSSTGSKRHLIPRVQNPQSWVERRIHAQPTDSCVGRLGDAAVARRVPASRRLTGKSG